MEGWSGTGGRAQRAQRGVSSTSDLLPTERGCGGWKGGGHQGDPTDCSPFLGSGASTSPTSMASARRLDGLADLLLRPPAGSAAAAWDDPKSRSRVDASEVWQQATRGGPTEEASNKHLEAKEKASPKHLQTPFCGGLALRGRLLHELVSRDGGRRFGSRVCGLFLAARGGGLGVRRRRGGDSGRL